MHACNSKAVGLSVCSAMNRSAQRGRTAAVWCGLVLGCAAGSVMGQTMMLVADGDTAGDKIVRFAYAPDEVRVIDHLVGKGISPLQEARFMTLTPDGDLLVSSSGNHSVQRYNAKTGEFLNTFISSGSGGLNFPLGLTYGPDGNLYVASADSDRVLRYDGTTGEFLGTVATGIDRPVNIVFSADGTMFVSAGFGNRVMKFDPIDGTHLGDVDMSGTGLNSPHGMAQDAAGNTYVSSSVSDRIIRIDADTEDASIFVTPGLGGLDNPLGLGFDDAGNLLVVSFENTSVLKYDSNGQFVEPVFFAATSGGLLSPIGLLLYTPCTADFNDDGTVNTQDFVAFLNAWVAGCP